jgi:hypothetical protein
MRHPSTVPQTVLPELHRGSHLQGAENGSPPPKHSIDPLISQMFEYKRVIDRQAAQL